MLKNKLRLRSAGKKKTKERKRESRQRNSLQKPEDKEEYCCTSEETKESQYSWIQGYKETQVVKDKVGKECKA